MRELLQNKIRPILNSTQIINDIDTHGLRGLRRSYEQKQRGQQKPEGIHEEDYLRRKTSRKSTLEDKNDLKTTNHYTTPLPRRKILVD